MPSRKCRTKSGKFKKCRSKSSRRSKSKKRSSRSKSKRSRKSKRSTRSKSSRRSKSKSRKSKRCRSKGRFSPCADKIPTAPKAPRMRQSKHSPGYNIAGSKLKHCSTFADAASCGKKPRCVWYSYNGTCNPATSGNRAAALKLGGLTTAKYSPVCTSIGDDKSKCQSTWGCKWVGGNVSPRCRISRFNTINEKYNPVLTPYPVIESQL
jgi:hypothetical protein